MKRHLVFAAAVLTALLASEAAFSQVSVSVIPSIGPNHADNYNAPNTSTAAYISNALGAFLAGQSTGGTPGTPGYYAPTTSPINTSSVLATSTASWLGTPNPTGAYANEAGNNLYLGVKATSAGGFTLASLGNINVTGTPVTTQPGYVSTSNSVASTLASNFSGSLAGLAGTTGYYVATAGTTYYGQNLGANVDGYTYGGALPSAGTTITGLFYVGGASGFGTDTPADGLLATSFYLPNGVTLSGSVSGAPGSGFSFNINTPEPASMAILGVGVVGLLGYTYRRRRLSSCRAEC